MEPTDYPTPEELAALGLDLAEVKAGQAGWGQAEQRVMKAAPRLLRAYKALLADADPYVFAEGKKAGRREAIVEVLRFLRAEERKFERGGREMQSAASRERCGIRASLLTTLIGQIDRGDHEREP
jgi:hypothetical protein